MYRLLRNILFNFDAEKVHYLSMNLLHHACNLGAVKKIISTAYQFPHPSLQTQVFGLHFKNPVGLAAGFDKNALYIRELATLGFGFVEIGTVTPLPQPGNDRPRLFRLPKDKAIINRMGFNNNGVKAVAARLRATSSDEIIIGGNIGKNKSTPNEDAWKDYVTCFNELFDCVDYFVINVSSPNTPGLRALQEKNSLLSIGYALQQVNQGKMSPKPLLLKIAPDLSNEQLNDILEIADEVKLNGIVATNTTIEKNHLKTPLQIINKIGAGGLSGQPLQLRSTEIIKYLHTHTHGQLPIIGSGGIFNGTDAKEKINAGASLIQVWTGFVYEGPGIVKNICKELSAK